MQTFAFHQQTSHCTKRNLRRAIELIGDSLPSWGAITATELILFYYEKVNYKLKKFEARFIIRYFD
jgi:hypothetical protein